jgi:hypothetical protein
MSQELRTCERCGMQFYVGYGTSKVTTCPECPIIVRAVKGQKRSRGHHAYDMALELVTIRIAFEMIEPLLKMGRRKEATEVYDHTRKDLNSRPSVVDVQGEMKKIFEVLEEVEAPARNTSFDTFAEEDHEIDYEGIVLLEAENESEPRSRGQ